MQGTGLAVGHEKNISLLADRFMRYGSGCPFPRVGHAVPSPTPSASRERRRCLLRPRRNRLSSRRSRRALPTSTPGVHDVIGEHGAHNSSSFGSETTALKLRSMASATRCRVVDAAVHGRPVVRNADELRRSVGRHQLQNRRPAAGGGPCPSPPRGTRRTRPGPATHPVLHLVAASSRTPEGVVEDPVHAKAEGLQVSRRVPVAASTIRSSRYDGFTAKLAGISRSVVFGGGIRRPRPRIQTAIIVAGMKPPSPRGTGESSSDVAARVTAWTRKGCGVGLNVSSWVRNSHPGARPRAVRSWSYC